MTPILGSLCTGYGGLELALVAAGVDHNLIFVADNDPDAATVVAHHYPDTPNLGDITAIDWHTITPVDILTAGYPCRDLSNAGKRAGINGAHSGIWRNVADAIRVLRPRLVILENVAAHLARGFGRVLGDLAAIGYDATWTCLRASDVGACHQRDRVFILATLTDPDSECLRLEPVPVGARLTTAVAGGDRESGLMPTPTASLGSDAGLASPALAAGRMASGHRFLNDAVSLLPTPWASEGAKGGPNQRGSAGDLTLTSAVLLLPTPTARDSGGGCWAGGDRGHGRPLTERVALLPTPTAVDHKGTRNATAGRTAPLDTTHHDGWTLSDVAYADRWGHYGAAIRRWEAAIGRSSPEPTVIGKRGGRRLSAPFVEWMMGLPEAWVTDHVDNTTALRLLGNGVVPAQGARAFGELLAGVAT